MTETGRCGADPQGSRVSTRARIVGDARIRAGRSRDVPVGTIVGGTLQGNENDDDSRVNPGELKVRWYEEIAQSTVGKSDQDRNENYHLRRP